MSYTFKPASTFTERMGLFVALVSPTNAGKTYSSLRLARGIAGPDRKVAVIDTEGGRTLHLKKDFDFDVMILEPPHSPSRYVEAVKAAQDAGYAAVIIDSWSMAWRGVGGVLDTIDRNVEEYIEQNKQLCADKGWRFDEGRARNKGKAAASIRPMMEYKLAVLALLGMRIPIIFSIRGGMSYDPDEKKEIFKAQCQPLFLFEVTVSFRLAADKKGYVDLSDSDAWKMEKDHRLIFKDGERIEEKHGAMLEAWATHKLTAAHVATKAATPAEPVGWSPDGGWPKFAGESADLDFEKWSTKFLANASPTEARAWEARYRKALQHLAGHKDTTRRSIASELTALFHERAPADPADMFGDGERGQAA